MRHPATLSPPPSRPAGDIPRRAALALLLAAGCAPVAAPPPPEAHTAAQLFPSGGRWRVFVIDDDGQGVPAGVDVWLQRRGAQVSGSSGCNRFGGRVSVGPGARLAFGDLTGTLMACADARAMQTEARFMNALQRVDGVRGVPERPLLTAGGAVVLTLVAEAGPDA